MLNHRQEIEIGVVKPRDLGPIRRGPHTLCILYEEAIALKHHAFGGKAINGFVDIVDFERKHRISRRRDRRHARHAHRGVLALENGGEAVIAQELQAKRIAIKRGGRVLLHGGDAFLGPPLARRAGRVA